LQRQTGDKVTAIDALLQQEALSTLHAIENNAFSVSEKQRGNQPGRENPKNPKNQINQNNQDSENNKKNEKNKGSERNERSEKSERNQKNKRNEYLLLIEQAVQNALLTLQEAPAPEHMAKEAVHYALAHLSEREAAFEHKQVMEVALNYALGGINMAQVQQATLAAQNKGELIRGMYSVDGTRWTTQEALAMEKEIIALAQTDQGKLPPLAPSETVENYLDKRNEGEGREEGEERDERNKEEGGNKRNEGNEKNEKNKKNEIAAEHKDVLRGLFSQKDRVCVVQGYAGTGKTTLLYHVNALLAEHGQSLLCLAPTHVAVKEIRARGLEGQTLDQFLSNYRAGKIPTPQSNTVIVVDEASMVSNRRMHDFLKAVIALDARALAMGDTQQYPAIESGKPFANLQKAQVRTFTLTDITRQKDAVLQAAVQETYQKEFRKAFQTLEKNIIEIGSQIVGEERLDQRDKRLEAIAKNYLDRTPEKRAQTVVITLGNDDRVLVNALIREGLKEQGELFGQGAVVNILAPRQMSDVECTRVVNYHLGEIIRFNQGDSLLGIEKGQYCQIKEIHAEHNALLLEKANQEKPESGEAQEKNESVFLWKPRDITTLQNTGDRRDRMGVEVYRQDQREILAGDLIRWTRSDKELGLLSPELAQVTQVSHPKTRPTKIEVRPIQLTPQGITAQGDPFWISAEKLRFQHWDHAYAMTGYSAQGKTIREVIAHAESFRAKLANQPSFLVVQTRAEHALTIYTDNKEALLNAILKNTGEKQSALEIMGEFPYGAPHNTPAAISQSGSAKSKHNLSYPISSQKKETINEKINKKVSKKVNEQINEKILDGRRIQAMLKDQAEAVVERLLGPPKSKEAGHYRYGGHKGSLIVTLEGSKRGLWHDFQTGEGGNLLKLIANHRGLDVRRDFKTVLKNALEILGTSENNLHIQSTQTPLKKAASDKPKDLTPQQQKSIQYARQLARESQSIANTLAERYLREHRGISLAQFPSNIRFHPGIYSKQNKGIYPALLVVAKDSCQKNQKNQENQENQKEQKAQREQKVQAVQAIFLDPHSAQKANVSVKKQTWGVPSKASVQITQTPHKSENSNKNKNKNENKNGLTYLAEGPETALSIYAALGGGDVRITLGKSNFKNIDPHTTGKHIVLCLDNDGKNPNSEKLIQFAAEKLLSQSKQVWVAQPKRVGYDYNDVLKNQGLAAVKKDIENAIPYQNYHDQTQADVYLKSVQTDSIKKIQTVRMNIAENNLIKLDKNKDLIRRVAGTLKQSDLSIKNQRNAQDFETPFGSSGEKEIETKSISNTQSNKRNKEENNTLVQSKNMNERSFKKIEKSSEKEKEREIEL
jgi:hypothetical protein